MNNEKFGSEENSFNALLSVDVLFGRRASLSEYVSDDLMYVLNPIFARDRKFT